MGSSLLFHTVTREVRLKLRESGSSIGVFMDCPKKYEFSYIKRLASSYYQSSTGFGSITHAFVEDYHRKRQTLMSPVDQSALAGATSATSSSVDLLLKDLEETYTSSEDRAQIAQDHAIAAAAFEEWRKYWEAWKGDLSCNSYHLLRTENEWEFELIDAKGRTSTHVGKSDAVIQHENYGTLLYELKTSGDPSREAYKHKLMLDKQIGSNLIALQKSMNNTQAKGVLYDIIWKPAIRLKKEETVEEFTQRKIQEYKTRPEHYFERLMVFRNEQDLQDYGLDLFGQYAALRGVAERGRYYRNTNACEKFGKLCPFFNLCMDPGMKEQEDTFRKRDRKFPELSLKIQE